jgi:predicted transposase/invertase (TIGR01784 family)
MSEKRVTVKQYEELSFRDDFMFGKVMQDLGLCKDVIECLLGRSIGELAEAQSQKEFKFTKDGKSIRLDVFNRDSLGEIFDTEMQNLNHKSIENLDLPRRSRFYQSSIDIDFMEKNMSYKSLPDSNVLFICTFDPFGDGLCQYTFGEICKETGKMLEDGTAKIFYNCTYTGVDIPKELAQLYDYIETGNTTNPLTQRINSAVEKGRRNEIWRTEYMHFERILMDARDEGLEEGRKEGREEGRKEGREEGRKEGREEERANTERERARADAAIALLKEHGLSLPDSYK